MEQAFSIIKKEDIDNCDEYAAGSINESELQDLIKVLSFSYPSPVCLLFVFFLTNSLLAFQAMLRMKILELRCEDFEDQVVDLRKHLENNIEVIKGLLEFVSPLIKKAAILETKVKELEVQCASHVDLFIFVDEEKIHLSKEPGKLREELSNAEMRVVAKYSTSQEYHNDLGVHYVRGFEHFCT